MGFISDLFGGGSGASDSTSYDERFRLASPQINDQLKGATGLYNMGPMPYVSEYVGLDPLQARAYDAGAMVKSINPLEMNQRVRGGNNAMRDAMGQANNFGIKGRGTQHHGGLSGIGDMAGQLGSGQGLSPEWNQELAEQVRGFATDSPYLDSQIDQFRANTETARKAGNVQNDFGAGFGGGLGSSYAALMNAKTNMDAARAANEAETGMRSDIWNRGTEMGVDTARQYGSEAARNRLQGMESAGNLYGMQSRQALSGVATLGDEERRNAMTQSGLGMDAANAARESLRFDQTQRLGLGEMARGAEQGAAADFANMIRYPWMAQQNRLQNLQGLVDTKNAGFRDSETTGDVMGDAGKAVGTVASLFAMSDQNLKQDIVSLGQVGGLPYVSWVWNDNASELGLEGHSIGFIAQDVQEHYPEFVKEQDNGYLAINYGGLLAHLESIARGDQ
jgi:hypothetical protein